MRTIKLQIAATETHCQYLCKFLDGTWPQFLDGTWPRCNAFPDSKTDVKYDSESGRYQRLPECIAAEKEAGK